MTSFTITIETNSLQLQQSEMSTYLNDFYSSFPENKHKSKSQLFEKQHFEFKVKHNITVICSLLSLLYFMMLITFFCSD